MEISIAAEKLFSIGTFPVTNAFLIGVLVSIFLVSVTQLVVRKKTLVPRGIQNILEIIFEALLDLIESVTQDKKQARQFFPLIATIFLFVLLANWVGLLPGLGTVGLSHINDGHSTIIPFLRSTSADLNFTLALSLITVLTVQFTGIAALGIVRYGKKFFVSPFHKPYGIGTLVGVLELVSEVGKTISFTFRLFGNVFAGEVLLTVMLHLVPFFLPLPFMFLEIFVGFIQAIVFSMLTLVFLKMATIPAEH
ncbi:MAG: F0F1 ATP synthase subunit A [Candidatus Moranbacteria bacterium]|nr:F0F1 ATP synthase subunit A [Candidatus Moranbacteria bacterium]MDD3964497.1 F0F1 ATP synthase subunit A [Candidatus Moranbacteria bacterium]